MPRRKQWRRSERRKTEWIERSRVDDGDGTVMDRERRGTDCGDDVTLSPPNVVAGSPPNVVAGSPPNVVAGSSPKVVAGSPSNVVAHDKGKQINGKNKQFNDKNMQKHAKR